MAESEKPRLAQGLRGFLDTGLAAAQTRIELLVVEVQEEKLRVASFLFSVVAAALLLSFGLICGVVLITVALWDTHRLLALGCGTGVLLAGGLFAGRTAARQWHSGSRLFATSLAELSRDRAGLERHE